jgi:peptidyl-prolyl cis-trans isomerase SurA
MMIAGRQVTVDSVVSIFKARPDLWNTPLHRTSLGNQLDKITEQLVFSAKANLQEKSDPEFAALLKDYREGILLYQVEQEQVWNNIVANDSVLQAFHGQTRDRYSFPDRVNFTSVSSPTEHASRLVYDKMKSGKSLEQILIEDSLRMAAPLHHLVLFGSGKATLTAAAKKVLAPIAREFKADPALRLRVTAFPDTFTNAKKALDLANRRMEAVRKGLINMGVAAERMPVEIRPQLQRAPAGKDTARLSLRVDLNILGRQPNVFGRPETVVFAPSADDRARHADSLEPGGISAPFQHKVGWTIVRLNAREPARLKTFEEATAEISSAFQDFEAKRLETAWIDGIRARNPVMEYKQELPKAFAPEK